MTRPRILRLCFVFVAFTVTGQPDARAQEETFAKDNCALTPPPEWQRLEIPNQPDVIVAYGINGRSRILILMARERGHAIEAFDDSVAAAFDRGMEKSGANKRTSGKLITFNGFSAYERTGELNAKGRHMSSLVTAIATGDGMYCLQGLSAEGDAAADTEIRQAIDSFHFIHPPGPARPPRNTAYKIGYAAGLLSFPSIIIVVIVWLIVRSRSRKPGLPNGVTSPYPATITPPPLPRPPIPPPAKFDY